MSGQPGLVPRPGLVTRRDLIASFLSRGSCLAPASSLGGRPRGERRARLHGGVPRGRIDTRRRGGRTRCGPDGRAWRFGDTCSFRQCAYAPCSTVGGVVVVSGEDGEPQPTAAATMAADSTEYAKSRATVSRRTGTAGPTDVEPGRRRRRRVPRRRPDRRRRRCRRAVWRRRPERRTCCAPAHR